MNTPDSADQVYVEQGEMEGDAVLCPGTRFEQRVSIDFKHFNKKYLFKLNYYSLKSTSFFLEYTCGFSMLFL